MRWRARSVAVAAVLLAVVAQGAVVARLNVPLELLPLVVVATATRLSQGEAAAIGFVAGVFADLYPPAPGILGGQALLCTLIGLLAARQFPRIPAVWWTRAVWAAALATLAVVAGYLLAVVVGRPDLSFASTWPTLLGELILGSVVAAGLLPLIALAMGPGPRVPLGGLR